MFMNKDRVLGVMKEQRINALVATTPENVTYATDLEHEIPTALNDLRGQLGLSDVAQGRRLSVLERHVDY